MSGLSTWFIFVSWSYDLDLIQDYLEPLYSKKLQVQFWVSDDDELTGFMMYDAPSRSIAEEYALKHIDNWLIGQDLPGITTYSTEIYTFAEYWVQLEAQTITAMERYRLDRERRCQWN